MLGAVIVLVTLAGVAGIGWACMGFWPDGWRLAVVAGAALAMSSTAIGLATLDERNILPTTGGQNILSVSLFQDIAAIPLLALIPLMAEGSPSTVRMQDMVRSDRAKSMGWP